jgi:hypothetical protein
MARTYKKLASQVHPGYYRENKADFQAADLLREVKLLMEAEAFELRYLLSPEKFPRPRRSTL